MTTPVEAVGLAIGVAQTLLALLQTSNQLREMCSRFHCEAQLQQLTETMTTITALFLDVDAKRQQLTHGGRDWIDKLKDAVYDVDDLLDEFRTIGQLRKQNKDAKFRKKVGEFFSRNYNFFVNFNVSREIKMLTEKLAAITKDHKDFGLTDAVFLNEPVVREETCSVSKLEIIGREQDTETIVGMLLSNNPHPDRNVCFVNIVGVGGLGKTALAQLVYKDNRVIEAFSQRIWVCVSEVSEKFNLQQILSKILKKKAFDLEQAQEEVRHQLRGKRYLLVLDDVWIESVEEWNSLKSFLVSDVSGSKVLVTTRSKKVARATTREDSVMHNLEGLSEENSWCLFKLIAFGKQTEDHQVDPDLVSIGKKIVKRCANVPLSIRVIASLLYDQGKDKWETFMSIDLADMIDEDGESSIMSTLMFSYYQLTPELKSCFSLCSLFPKDHIIKKEVLINLWSAQGYLVATNNAQSVEYVGECYFTVLLNRSFFQDVMFDELGDIVLFKMHDLMHDLALKVAGKESFMMTPTIENPSGGKIRHLSRGKDCSNLCLSDKLRSYVWLGDDFSFNCYAEDSNEVSPIMSNCKRLRVLSLPGFGIGCSLLKKVGKLLHLRYLDLTKNRLEMLPKSITKLHNLQTLILRGCRDLKKLPDDIGKLVNLRMLDISHCENLNELPEDIGKLVNLRTLDISFCQNLIKLPEDIGKLVNLRTLDISECGNLKVLPENIGKLVNMRTLDASYCSVLKELPEDMSKLVNLRALDISKCNKLTYMPRGMDNLTNLQRLSDFIVGGVDVKQIEGSKLVDLQALIKNLKGDLRIRILKFSSHNMPLATNRAFILKNARLKKLLIQCSPYSDQSEIHETLVENLCPNEDICDISMFGYEGMRMPSWTTSLSRFRCLKELRLMGLLNVEYIMEIENDGAWESSTLLFFPVLEYLDLREMPKLKGWWRGLRWREMEGVAGGCLVDDNGLEHAVALPCFPRLSKLIIYYCKSMTYFPPCPHVKEMELLGVNDALTFCLVNVSTSSSCLERLTTFLPYFT